MNIAIIATLNSFHERFNKNNILILKNMGFKVHLISNESGLTLGTNRCEKFLLFCSENNVVSHHIDIPRSPFRFVRLLNSYLQIVEIMINEKIVFVHSHTPVGGLLGRLVSRKLGLNNIYTAHGFHFYKGAGVINWALYYSVEKILSRFTDILITMNSEDYEFSLKNFKTKTYFVPGIGINYKLYCTMKPTRKGDISIMSVGELNKNKNHELIINSLSKTNYSFHYLIAGSGKLESQLNKLINKTNQRNKIRLLGFVDDVSGALKEVDIFILPSKREGLPVALMEAMATGVPIIASNIRGNRDLIDHGLGGFLFNLKNPEDLLNFLGKLINDSSLRNKMGQYNQNKAKSYSTEIIDKYMQNIYIELLNINRVKEYEKI